MHIQSQIIEESPYMELTRSIYPPEETKSQNLSPKVLALSGLLQTTLEIDELLSLFSRELNRIVKVDGLDYSFPELKIDISLGDKTTHSCRYTLIVADEDQGELMFFRQYAFEDEELQTIENLLAALLYPLRNTLLYFRALQTSITDPLTGVGNRNAMNNAMQRELSRARRHHTPLSLILLDIDHFKKINDEHGHLYGDRALHAVAQCAKKSIRTCDMIFRYGGEEFLIMLTGTELTGAQQLAERLRAGIEEMVPIQEKDFRLTVSLGVTMFAIQEDGTSLFQRVDSALYQAKENGRNQAVTA